MDLQTVDYTGKPRPGALARRAHVGPRHGAAPPVRLSPTELGPAPRPGASCRVAGDRVLAPQNCQPSPPWEP
ncbi:hypothetical protein D9X30_5631 [Cupriavidus sp. U2]|nr:hypothetical protein D9X30_5631 [Cupriavidus sp. U2]